MKEKKKDKSNVCHPYSIIVLEYTVIEELPVRSCGMGSPFVYVLSLFVNEENCLG